MKKIYVIGMALFILVCVAIVFRFGVVPRAESILKPSYFKQPEELGTLLFRRFYAEVGVNKWMVYGVPPQPDVHRHVISGFLKAARAENRGFDVILAEPNLDPLPDTAGAQVVPMQFSQEDPREALRVINSFTSQGKKVFVYTVSIFSTHLLKGNAVHRIEQATHQAVFAITSGGMVLNFQQEYMVDPPCLGSARDNAGTADLGCTILQSSRMYYRKKLDPSRLIGVIDREGSSDYLLMIWAPGVDHPANPAEPNTSGSGMLAPPPNMPMPKAAFSQGQSMVPEDEEGSGSYADPNGFVRHGKKKQPHNTVPADSDSTTVINSNVEEDVN